jgi:molybdate transport system substrate-binding protein
MIRLCAIVVWSLLCVSGAFAATARVAVAANFLKTAETLAAEFEAETGHSIEISSGATGLLFAQISQGAPFDVFLAADAARPQRAEDEGLAVPGSRFTYALGQLVLYGPGLNMHEGAEVLSQGGFVHLALADPSLAPYGAAARQALMAMGLWESLADQLVLGTSVTQTLQFIETGNAELGFVAYSQVAGRTDADIWVVPPELYDPIRQDAVLLMHGAGNEAAIGFLDYLKSDEALASIMAAGYGTDGR